MNDTQRSKSRMILLISTCQERLSEKEFVEPIAEMIGKCKVKHYLDVEDVEEYEKIIICGTALKDNQFLEGDFSWLKETEKPVLGICAGMQVIALTFGAKLIDLQEIGMVGVKVEQKNKLMDEDFSAYALHNKSIENLNEFNILATSKTTVQSIKHKSKEIHGILFHSEVRNMKIIENFLEL